MVESERCERFLGVILWAGLESDGDNENAVGGGLLHDKQLV